MELVSTTKAEKLTGISASTWSKWVKKGLIRGNRAGSGRSLKIPLEDVELMKTKYRGPNRRPLP